ncbi:SPOR domain-containing protein [Legionella pneumophila]|uniref:SPOR domain-containing protein n=1 Tax=Legionella pneumophila TaxID=446 RepID=UPI001E3D2C68|nr:SPOR domain-containing protein [Legionella pneumophila]MDW9139034.1 SPOR domain-containing protein [Legionella pneumophila]
MALLFIITLNLDCISVAFSSQVIYGTQNAARVTGKSLKKIYFLQLGAFAQKNNAQQLARKIHSCGACQYARTTSTQHKTFTKFQYYSNKT